METEHDTADWYRNYYLKKGKDRNDLLTNPEVTFQHLAIEESVLSALKRATTLNRESSRVLDVGRGSGGSLARFLALGFRPNNLFGIDILQERIDEGRTRYPNLNLVCDDATSMRYESGLFDLVLESTMFVQITDERLSKRISDEMLRVTKAGGYLLLIDWRYSKPRDPAYRAVNMRRIREMFGVGVRSDVVCQSSGALVPPVGRALSRFLPSAYFPVRAIFPFLVGTKSTLLQKRHP
jgi:SAM-dependent methyltransferase